MTIKWWKNSLVDSESLVLVQHLIMLAVLRIYILHSLGFDEWSTSEEDIKVSDRCIEQSHRRSYPLQGSKHLQV